ncbi:hypothetical protein PMAYCL1PPCAC_27667, partial [Pristionchus mayeri]
WRRRNSKTLWKPAARMRYSQMLSFGFFFSLSSSSIFLDFFCDSEVLIFRSSKLKMHWCSDDPSTLFSALDIEANF